MKLPIFQIDAFSDEVFGGNPAAVCPLSNWLADETMQSIAAENNLSETAFFVPEFDRFRIRWFTPKSEVDLCGHATLAAAWLIFKQGYGGNQLFFDSNSGLLTVKYSGDGLLTMDFPTQSLERCDIPSEITAAFGTPPLEVHRGADYLALYESAEQVLSLQPDFMTLRKLNLRGVTVTAPGDDVDFVSRFFAPNFGIDEDPVTGSAHCALTPFWSQRLKKKLLSAKQLSKRGGKLLCELDNDRVLISGVATCYLEGTINLDE